MVGFHESLVPVELGKILGGVKVRAIDDPVTSGAKSTLLPPAALSRQSLSTSVLDFILGAVVLVVIVVLEIASTPGKVTTRRTIFTVFSCTSCGVVFNTWSLLVSHMAKITCIALMAMASPPVLADFITLFGKLSS